MATVTRENISLLNDKLIVNLSKEDYFNSFEKSLKSYAKKASIQGFRKGMVPAGLIKKMYGQSVFTDEVLRTVEKELTNYMTQERLDIFAQPLPLESDARRLDMNNPRDYAFAFEIGLKPEIEINVNNIQTTLYKVQVTEEMTNQEIERLQTRYGRKYEPEEISNEENILELLFTEADSSGSNIENGIEKSITVLVKHFTPEMQSQLTGRKKDDALLIRLNTAFNEKERAWILKDLGIEKDSRDSIDTFFNITITKISTLEKAELTEEFFNIVYAASDITAEEEFRNAVKAEIENYSAAEARNQMHDQLYHYLIDNTKIDFPENFLKRWLQTGGDKPKTEDEVNTEYPLFASQLKWTLISGKLINDNKITVEEDEIKEAALRQVSNYMGGKSLDDVPWLGEYVNRMMQDKKFVENTYHKIQTEKLFSILENKAAVIEESISAEGFAEKLHHHHQ